MTKHDILNYFRGINHAYNDSTRFNTLSHMIDELLEEHPDIVRCQDCKYSEHIGGQGYRCYIWDCLVNHGNGFCNYGERKDNYND